MANKTTKVKNRVIPSKILQTILEEIRLLRKEVMILLPQDNLEDYAHPERIQRSFQKAIKKHPPAGDEVKTSSSPLANTRVWK